VGKSNFFWQSESGAVHVGFRGYVSNIVKADHVLFTEICPLHRFSNTSNKKLERVWLFLFICKTVNVNQWQLNLILRRRLPDKRISFIEESNKNVEELHRVHRQIHEAVIELEHFCWHCFLLGFR